MRHLRSTSLCPALSRRLLLPPGRFALLVLSGNASAHAAVLLRVCRPADFSLVCRLQGLLALLEIAAPILAVLLALAVFAAVRAYRRKPRKLTPEDITPDAQ